MEITITETPKSSENWRRFWRRRRRYQRLRSGEEAAKVRRRPFRLGRVLWHYPRPAVKIVSPLKMLVRLHDAYVATMVRLANGVGNIYGIGAGRGGRRSLKGGVVSVGSCREEVDAKLVMEMYKKLAASKHVAAF